jgi:hypothetical protein
LRIIYRRDGLNEESVDRTQNVSRIHLFLTFSAKRKIGMQLSEIEKGSRPPMMLGSSTLGEFSVYFGGRQLEPPFLT